MSSGGQIPGPYGLKSWHEAKVLLGIDHLEDSEIFVNLRHHAKHGFDATWVPTEQAKFLKELELEREAVKARKDELDAAISDLEKQLGKK